MALNNVSLNKFLKISRRNLPQRITMIKKDARDSVNKEKKIDEDDGGNFYGEFWKDAKDYVFAGSDLKAATADRIQKHSSKKRLYPIMLNGFLTWFGSYCDEDDYAEREELTKFFGRCSSLSDSGSIRIHGLLAWKDTAGIKHGVYPFFDKDAALGINSARLALWAMANALAKMHADKLIVLDVLRGVAFDNDNTPLLGNEEDVLADQYGRMLREWENQKTFFRKR